MSESKKIRILIADDSHTVREMFSKLLISFGYEVILAEDGFDAVTKAYKTCPDLILLDIFMPTINGYQVCRLLKSEEASRGIPIIILTGSNTYENRFWSRQTGADRFLSKDFKSNDILKDVIAELLNEYQDKKPSPVDLQSRAPEDAVEILSRLSALLDSELYTATVDKMKLEIIFSSINEGMFTVNEAGVITAFNRALERLTGITQADAAGKNGKEFFKDSLCRNRCFFDEAISEKKDIADSETVLKIKNGSLIPVLFSVALIKGDQGNIEGAICVVRDITGLKEVERLKADFTAMMTHEIINPVSAIKSTAGMFLEGVLGPVTAEQKDFINSVKLTSERLISLVNDLFLISKMERGRVSLKPAAMDIREAAKKSIDGFVEAAGQKRIEIILKSTDADMIVEADKPRIEQVYTNIISNAVHFTPENGRITVEITDKGGFVESTVHDSGAGIPQDSLTRIFDKFQQIYDTKSRNRGGTGLGLAVVKAIIEAHGGTVWAESETGKGAKILFRLPKKQEREERNEENSNR